MMAFPLEAYLKKEKGMCGHDIDCDIRRLVAVTKRAILHDGGRRIFQISFLKKFILLNFWAPTVATITRANVAVNMGRKSFGLAIPINSGASVLCLSWSRCPKIPHNHNSFLVIFFTFTY